MAVAVAPTCPAPGTLTVIFSLPFFAERPPPVTVKALLTAAPPPPPPPRRPRRRRAAPPPPGTFTGSLVAEDACGGGPELDAVTVQVRDVPASAAVTRYCDSVAPEIGVPSRFHWYAKLVGECDHSPGSR